MEGGWSQVVHTYWKVTTKRSRRAAPAAAETRWRSKYRWVGRDRWLLCVCFYSVWNWVGFVFFPFLHFQTLTQSSGVMWKFFKHSHRFLGFCFGVLPPWQLGHFSVERDNFLKELNLFLFLKLYANKRKTLGMLHKVRVHFHPLWNSWWVKLTCCICIMFFCWSSGKIWKLQARLWISINPFNPISSWIGRWLDFSWEKYL